MIEDALDKAIDMPSDQRNRQSNQAVLLTLIINIILAIVKTAIGIFGHSPALLADGINSTSDVVYNIVVSFFVRAAHKPADDEHPYGHSQFESVGALVVGAFVITTAITIFWDSIRSLFDFFSGNGNEEGAAQITLWIALATVIIKTFMSIYTHRIGKRTANATIIALAQDHRNDIFSALAVVIGISFSLMGFRWVDPLAGALVAIFIFHTGYEILRDSTDDLMDTLPGKALTRQISDLVMQVPGVHDVDAIKAHRFGRYLVINLAIYVDGNISVDAGDAISDEVEDILQKKVDYVRDVHVHFHSKPHKN
jgi:cation diffusion facilitator family transporter